MAPSPEELKQYFEQRILHRDKYTRRKKIRIALAIILSIVIIAAATWFVMSNRAKPERFGDLRSDTSSAASAEAAALKFANS